MTLATSSRLSHLIPETISTQRVMSENILFTTAIINREIRNRLFIRSWLYVICLLVLAMVIVGGATRLTDSGLSITEWKPVLGIIPPLSSADWLDEFSKYQLIPQYTQINQAMTLGEFKFIYWWEWAHRFLGRIVGFVFAIPLAYFWMTARIESRLKPRLIFLLVLGGLQGFIGWWMVKSGLVDRVDVSQYRLAVHLTLACIIFAYSLWLARGFASQHHAGFNLVAGPNRIVCLVDPQPNARWQLPREHAANTRGGDEKNASPLLVPTGG